MRERREWTAEEIEALSPAKRDQVFRDAIVADPSEISPEKFARIRAHAERLAVQLGLDQAG